MAGQEKVKFRSALPPRHSDKSALWVAHKQGFFDQQGLDVQLVLTANRVDAVPFSSDEANLVGGQGCDSEYGRARTVKPPLPSPNTYIDHRLPRGSA